MHLQSAVHRNVTIIPKLFNSPQVQRTPPRLIIHHHAKTALHIGGVAFRLNQTITFPFSAILCIFVELFGEPLFFCYPARTDYRNVALINILQSIGIFCCCNALFTLRMVDFIHFPCPIGQCAGWSAAAATLLCGADLSAAMAKAASHACNVNALHLVAASSDQVRSRLVLRPMTRLFARFRHFSPFVCAR